MVLSRRYFLAGVLGTLGLAVPESQARTKAVINHFYRPNSHVLASLEWLPAIMPEYVGIVEHGYICLADHMGRMVICDLKQEDAPKVIGECFGIGHKIMGLSIGKQYAYAITLQDSNDDPQYYLVCLNLNPASDMTIGLRLPLKNFLQPTCISGTQDLIVIGGIGINEENQLAIYSAPKKHYTEIIQLSTLNTNQLPIKLDLQDKLLLSLCGKMNTELLEVSLNNPKVPKKKTAINLEGTYSLLARDKDSIAVIGYESNKIYQAKLLTLHRSTSVQGTVLMPQVTSVLDLIAQKEQFLALINKDTKQFVLPIILENKNKLICQEAICLPTALSQAALKGHLAVKDKDIYIAQDSGKLQILNKQKNNWQFSYSHTIPRLSASSVVFDGKTAVIAASDFKVYDLTNPQHPVLTNTIYLPGTVRAMSKVNTSFLCLMRDALSLRSIEKPASVLATMTISATQLCYDPVTSIAYVLSPNETFTTVQTLSVTDNSLQLRDSQDFPIIARHANAYGGYLLLAGLHDVILLKPEEKKVVATKQLTKLAIRNLSITKDSIYILCIDDNLHGYFMSTTLAKGNFESCNSLALPINAASCAITDKIAIVVGRLPENKDMAFLINIDPSVPPHIQENFNVLADASAIAIHNNLAIIAGRGLEVIRL